MKQSNPVYRGVNATLTCNGEKVLGVVTKEFTYSDKDIDVCDDSNPMCTDILEWSIYTAAGKSVELIDED